MHVTTWSKPVVNSSDMVMSEPQKVALELCVSIHMLISHSLATCPQYQRVGRVLNPSPDGKWIHTRNTRPEVLSCKEMIMNAFVL